jgi:hypothetical protein
VRSSILTLLESLTPGFSFRLTGVSGVIMMACESVGNMAESRIKALLCPEHRLVGACNGIIRVVPFLVIVTLSRLSA